ncbi:MAG: protein kinase [Thermoanaerobaculia bacterium]
MEDKDDKTLPVFYFDIQKEEGQPFSARFKNLKFLGQGGSGRVYKAHDTNLNEYVAIKLIEKKGLSEESKKRILREVSVARKLSHPNLVKYYDINEDRDHLIIIMEYIEGTSLDKKIRKEGPFKEEEIKNILLILVDVIKYLHDNKIIHRDIKPANIFITDKGEVKLGDFGIIHLKETHEKLTKTEQAIGTPTYMSPEQITGKEIDEKSDWYSLGITIYEMIQGDVPFSGTIGEIIKGHFEKEIPEVKSSKLFNKLIKGLTIKNPKKRWGYEEIKKYLEGKTLPLLPKQKEKILFALFSFAFIFLFYFFLIPEFLGKSIENAKFEGKKLKVFSKNKMLFEKETEKLIGDAKVLNKKEVIISYNIKAENIPKNPRESINVGEILNNKGSIISNFFTQYIGYSKPEFSINYTSKILPFNIINNGKIEKSNHAIRIDHTYYPCWLIFFDDIRKRKQLITIRHSGGIEGLCEWDGKIVMAGFNNVLFHQIFIAFFKKEKMVGLFFDISDLSQSLISYNLLGYGATTAYPKFYPEGKNLKIEISGTENPIILKPDGDFEGQKAGTQEITQKFVKDYGLVKYLAQKGNLEKAKEVAEEYIKTSEIFQIYGWTVVFASFLSNLNLLEGDVKGAVETCLTFAKKYEKYGFDLYNKAGFLALLGGDYKKALEIWEGGYYGEGFRAPEILIYPVTASILDENWKKVDELLSEENFAKEGIWMDYLRGLKGVSYLVKKDLKNSIETLKKSIEVLDLEDIACFYFLAKYISGEPDIENYEKFMKNYISGPLHLQFAGACTKGDWDKAKILYKTMENEAPWNSGISLVFPLVKKVIEKYPEKFNFL